MSPHRKRARHDHEPGDCHELTFSCYQRMPLLCDNAWRRELCISINRALQGHAFRLVAFVLMPDHVHLLVYPMTNPPEVDHFLYAVKRPYSFRLKQRLAATDSELLAKLTIRERPGKTVFRCWQGGPGYDRNFFGETATLQAIDYIHLNPVRRGLVDRARDWQWSSARWYESDTRDVDPDLPKIDGLPSEFFIHG